MPNAALERINQRRLVLQIRLDVEDIVDSLLFDCRTETHVQAGYLCETTRELLSHYARDGQIRASQARMLVPNMMGSPAAARPNDSCIKNV